jgi:hypothetical protein
VMDRGLPMPLPDLSRDFQGTEASAVAAISGPSRRAESDANKAQSSFVSAAWERLWADDAVGPASTPSHAVPSGPNRELVRALETKVARDGAWASETDERRFVDWLKRPLGK